MTNNRALFRRIRLLLRQHYTAPMAVMFKQFRDGAIYFSVGLMAIIMANLHMEASISQEIVVLLGLVLGGYGFMLAMLAQVRMIIARVIGFIEK